MLSFTIFGPVQSCVLFTMMISRTTGFMSSCKPPSLGSQSGGPSCPTFVYGGIWNQNAIPTVLSSLDNTHVLTIAYLCRRAPFILLCVAPQGQDMTIAQQRSFPYFVIWELVKAPLSPGMGTRWREAFLSQLYCMYTYFPCELHPKEL